MQDFFLFHLLTRFTIRILPFFSFFQQNKLKKEDAFTRLNVAKIKSEWRSILRNIKCKELHEDLKAIKKECDESIQRKNSIIRRLLDELDESEEIYSAMLHSHMNIIEKLITVSENRLDFLRKNYEVEKRKVLQTYEKDMMDYKNKKFQLQKELESVYYGLAERTLKTTKTAEEEYLQRADELKNSVRESILFFIFYVDRTMLHHIIST